MTKFVRRARPIYWWPVNVEIPSEKRVGSFDTQTVKLRFEPMLEDEREAHERDMASKFPEGGWKTDVELLKRVTKDWSDFDDEHGQTIAFSTEELEAACQYPPFRVAAVIAYYNSLNGTLARRGN